MIELIYDGTFEGLLTAIFYGYTYKEEIKITNNKNYLPSLLDKPIYIKTEEDKFNRVYKSILNKLSNTVLEKIYYVYLSEVNNSENIIMKYVKLCYKYGVNINLAKNNNIIIFIDKYSKKVIKEAHNFTGFVRFKEFAPLSFYSAIEPDHNILPLLIGHFVKRFQDQNFIIHDLKREEAIIYNKESVVISNLPKEKYKTFMSNCKNDEFENLWKTFFKATDIKERKNLRLQCQLMPKRYWKHMTEFQ